MNYRFENYKLRMDEKLILPLNSLVGFTTGLSIAMDISQKKFTFWIPFQIGLMIFTIINMMKWTENKIDHAVMDSRLKLIGDILHQDMEQLNDRILKEKTWVVTGIDEIEEELFNPIKNQNYFNKPEGGLWSGPMLEDREYVSDWQYFCHEEFRGKYSTQYVTFMLTKEAKVYTINSFQHLEELHAEYGLPQQDENSFMQLLDFEKIAKDYDAIYLTDIGQEETRFSKPSLYGWDVATLLVLNFKAIKK